MGSKSDYLGRFWRGGREEVGTLRIGSLEVRHFLKYSSVKMKESFLCDYKFILHLSNDGDLVLLILRLILNIVIKNFCYWIWQPLKVISEIFFLPSVISDLPFPGLY